MNKSGQLAFERAQNVARDSYGKLIAILAKRTHCGAGRRFAGVEPLLFLRDNTLILLGVAKEMTEDTNKTIG